MKKDDFVIAAKCAVCDKPIKRNGDWRMLKSGKVICRKCWNAYIRKS